MGSRADSLPGQPRRFGGRVDIGADEVPVPPTLQSPQRLGNGQFLIRVLGEAGLNYELQASANLTSWTSLGTSTAGTSTVDFTDTPGALSRRHYRAIARWVDTRTDCWASLSCPPCW